MATKYWQGGAESVSQIDDFTLGGTFAAGDNVKVSCGSRFIIVTIGSAVTIADVQAELVASINAGSIASPAPAAGYSRTKGGQEIPEFKEFAAAVQSTNKVRIIGLPGMTVAPAITVLTGSGTCSAASVQAATGPEFVDNAANYSGGVLPATGDKVIADSAAYAMKYGLGYFLTNTIALDLQFNASFKTGVGLPDLRQTVYGDIYTEYRKKTLDIYSQIGSPKSLVFIGNADPSNQLGMRFNAASQTFAQLRADVNSRLNAAGSAVEITGGTFQAVNLLAGFFKIDSAVLYNPTIGVTGLDQSSLSVVFGSGVDFSDADIISLNNGTTINYSNYVDNGTSDGVLNINGGTHTAAAITPDASRSAVVFAGTLKIAAGFGTVKISVYGGATLDLEQAPLGSLTTVSTIVMSAGATLNNRSGAAAGVKIVTAGCGLDAVTIKSAFNRELTMVESADIGPAP